MRKISLYPRPLVFLAAPALWMVFGLGCGVEPAVRSPDDAEADMPVQSPSPHPIVAQKTNAVPVPLTVEDELSALGDVEVIDLDFSSLITEENLIDAEGNSRIQRIGEPGQRIELSEHLVPGHVTLIDFHANWCAPCRVLASDLRGLLNSHEDVYLKKVNIAEFESPVAEQYAIQTLPSVWVFDQKGKLLASHLRRLEQIEAAVEHLEKPVGSEVK